MRVRKISGDGNCLFHSCAHLLLTCHCKVRESVSHIFKHHSDTLINNVKLSEWVKNSGYSSNYGHEIGLFGTWGDEICLPVIALVYKRSIEVYTKDHDNFRILSKYYPEFGNPIRLLFHQNHYDALVT